MIIYLSPKSPFPALSSDRLFGALCYAISITYKEEQILSKLLSKFQDFEPPFLLSSAFPFVNNKGTGVTHFFPKPLDRPKVIEHFEEHLPAAKTLKKVQYVDSATFFQWINGELDESTLLKDLTAYKTKGPFLYPKNLDQKGNTWAIETGVIPRNAINRLLQTSENIFYFTGETYKNLGLFFIIKFLDSAYQEIIKTAIKFLADRGFGKDISVGKGQFKLFPPISEQEFPFPSSGDRILLLSRYIPRAEELDLITKTGDCFYDLGTKRGRTRDGHLRKLVRFFLEGSTFPTFGTDPKGQLVHSYEQTIDYGFALSVPYQRRS